MKVTYSQPIKGDSRTTYQDIIINNNVVGALATIRNGILEPFTERWQRLVKDSEDVNAEYYLHSEDKGHRFAVYETLESFLKNIN